MACSFHVGAYLRCRCPPADRGCDIGSDVVILRAGIADGISIVDITDPNTPITSAEVGDVLMALMFRTAVWTRVGNIITGRGDATARAAIQELQLRYNYLAARGGATLQLYHLGAGNEQYTQDEFAALAGQNLTITGHIDDPVLLPAAGRFFLRIPNGAGGHTIKTQGGASTSELEVFQLNAVERTMRNQLTAGTVQFTFQLTAPEMVAIFTDASNDPIDAAFVAFDVGMSESGSNEEDVLAVFYEHLVGSAAGLTPEQAAEIQRDGQGVQTALAATRANAAEIATNKITAGNALARTQRIRPITQWVRGGGAQTLLLEWKPVGAIANNAALAVNINGAAIAGVTTSEGLAAADTNGTVISIPVNAANAGTIDRTSNAIAGHLEIQITHGGIVDACWMGVRNFAGWRALIGSSPYTVFVDDDEFRIEATHIDTGNYSIDVARVQLVAGVAKDFTIAEQRSTDTTIAEVNVRLTLNAAGTELTTEIVGAGMNNWSAVAAFAKRLP